MKFIKNNLSLIAFCLGILLFRTAVADWSLVPSSSMEPTIFPGDVLLINKTILGPAIPFTESRLFSYGAPQRGDIITFYPPHTDDKFVKRVIGVPGDTVRIEGLRVFINDKELLLELDLTNRASGIIDGIEIIDGSSHAIRVDLTRGVKDMRDTITVPEHKFFVMGDYRNNSEDSRYWGYVDEESILGKVTRVAVSIASERTLSEKIAHSIY